MLALGAKELNRPEDLKLAEEVAETCFQMYNQSPSKVAADESEIFVDGTGAAVIRANCRVFKLRPGEFSFVLFLMFPHGSTLCAETIESMYILFELTGKCEYLERGWQIFQVGLFRKEQRRMNSSNHDP